MGRRCASFTFGISAALKAILQGGNCLNHFIAAHSGVPPMYMA